MALGLTLALSSAAQDTNPGDCVVNGNKDNAECTPAAVPTAEAQQWELDWAPVDAVPAEQRDRQCINCAGQYIDPLAGEENSGPPEEEQIHARANNGQLQGDEVILDGGAQATQGNRRMYGDKVVIDRVQESATITGNVTLREPGVLLQGDSAKIYSKTGEATVSGGRYVFHNEHMRGTADLLERDADGLIHIHGGNFSYCAPGEEDWAI